MPTSRTLPEVEQPAALHARAAGHLPAADDAIDEAVDVAAPPLAASEGQRVHRGHLERVGEVADRAAVAHVDRIDALRQEQRLVAMPEHVAAGVLQPARGAPPELQRQRVVHRSGRVLDHVGAADQVGVDEEEVGRQPRVDRVGALGQADVVPPSAVAAVYGFGLNRASAGRYVVARNWFDVYSAAVAGAAGVDAVEVGEEDRQRRRARARSEVGERPGARAAGGVVGLQVRHRQLELVEEAVLDDVDLVVVVGAPVVLSCARRRSAPRSTCSCRAHA